jgi:hypothetical protein
MHAYQSIAILLISTSLGLNRQQKKITHLISTMKNQQLMVLLKKSRTKKMMQTVFKPLGVDP